MDVVYLRIVCIGWGGFVVYLRIVCRGWGGCCIS